MRSSCISRQFDVNKHFHFVRCESRWPALPLSVTEWGGHLPFIREFGSSSINPNRPMDSLVSFSKSKGTFALNYVFSDREHWTKMSLTAKDQLYVHLVLFTTD